MLKWDTLEQIFDESRSAGVKEILHDKSNGNGEEDNTEENNGE
jgi:hypothetical protein